MYLELSIGAYIVRLCTMYSYLLLSLLIQATFRRLSFLSDVTTAPIELVAATNYSATFARTPTSGLSPVPCVTRTFLRVTISRII